MQRDPRSIDGDGIGFADGQNATAQLEALRVCRRRRAGGDEERTEQLTE
jgi:hypothetical protein